MLRHHGLRATGRRLGDDRSAASAVEFALLLPVILALWAGASEMGHGVDNGRKVTLLARTVADLTSQGDPTGSATIQPATMSDILAASSAVLRPFNASTVKIKVSALAVDLTKSATSPVVCSSAANANDKPRTTGVASDLSIPLGFQTNRYVLAEVSMVYAPMIGGSLVKLIPGIKNPITLTGSFAWPTRGGQTYNGNTYSEVVLPNGTQC